MPFCQLTPFYCGEEGSVLTLQERCRNEQGISHLVRIRNAHVQNRQGLHSVERPEVPKVKDAANPIDAFLLEKLDEKGLAYNPAADARSLIRRTSILMTGLPPSAEQVETFSKAYARNEDRAYTRLVDELLESPHFGERWAQHWLDVIRWAETNGLLVEVVTGFVKSVSHPQNDRYGFSYNVRFTNVTKDKTFRVIGRNLTFKNEEGKIVAVIRASTRECMGVVAYTPVRL